MIPKHRAHTAPEDTLRVLLPRWRASLPASHDPAAVERFELAEEIGIDADTRERLALYAAHLWDRTRAEHWSAYSEPQKRYP